MNKNTEGNQVQLAGGEMTRLQKRGKADREKRLSPPIVGKTNE